MEVVASLAGSGFAVIVVVDDGSGPSYRHIFDELLRFDPVRVMRHAVNLGKGAALKTGMNYALVEYPAAHRHRDRGCRWTTRSRRHPPTSPSASWKSPKRWCWERAPLRVASPLRSLFGNSLTRAVMRLVEQPEALRYANRPACHPPRPGPSGCSAYPASGYEFELEMLVAGKAPRCPVNRAKHPHHLLEPGNPNIPLRAPPRLDAHLFRPSFASDSFRC